MNPGPLPSIDRLYELLADEATQGLSAGDRAERDRLLAKWPHVEEASFAQAAAALDRALSADDVSPLPLALREQIERDAPAVLAGRERPARRKKPREHSTAVFLAWTGWLTAAACLMLALYSARQNVPERDLGPAEQLAQLEAIADDLRRIQGTAPEPEKQPEVHGQLVWSHVRQEGYLKLIGLPANDPTRSQYQLWIFDAGRDERYPIDAGVFDLADGTCEIVIPIRAKLHVHDPKLFAVTVEPPGGVVVSRRDPVVFVAQVR